MSDCICGSQQPFEQCCEIYLKGEQKPETAEQLMRSRYAAHVRVDMQYMMDTHHPETRKEINVDSTARWARECQWQTLQIQSVEKGGVDDDEGIIEFIAPYRDARGQRKVHHEVSLFQKVDGVWYFRDAAAPKVSQVTRGQPKVGRNDPCTCGSGKKYKKCCGKS